MRFLLRDESDKFAWNFTPCSTQSKPVLDEQDPDDDADDDEKDEVVVTHTREAAQQAAHGQGQGQGRGQGQGSCLSGHLRDMLHENREQAQALYADYAKLQNLEVNDREQAFGGQLDCDGCESKTCPDCVPRPTATFDN